MSIKLNLFDYRQSNCSEGRDTDPPDNHIGDQKQEEPLQQSDPSPPVVSEGSKENEEAEQDQDKSQLTSSVIIEVPNEQSSLELSTITGSQLLVKLLV